MVASVRILNYQIYLKEFLILFFCFFFTDECFAWFFIRDSYLSEVIVKALSLLFFGVTLYAARRLRSSEQIYLAIFTTWILYLILKSLVYFQKPFVHFQVYTVIYPVIYVVFLKYVFRTLNADLLGFLVRFHIGLYILFMLFFGRAFSFSLAETPFNSGPFSGDSRIIHAQTLLVIIIPYLWYLNRFILKQQLTDFLLFLLCFTILLLHQHRSVWTAAIISTALYFFMLWRNSAKGIKGTGAFLTISGVLLVCVLYFVSTAVPGFIEFFGMRFSEILSPEKTKGTGGFRLEQSNAYLVFIIQRPFLGWNFEGYELKNPLVSWWADNTGHHFHQGYIEMLFYHGILGLLFKYSFLLYALKKAFSRNLSNQSIILVAFVVSGLVFSFSYVLPLMFWAYTALCLHYLDNTKRGDAVSEGI